jgi:hypothetical protein
MVAMLLPKNTATLGCPTLIGQLSEMEDAGTESHQQEVTIRIEYGEGVLEETFFVDPSSIRPLDATRLRDLSLRGGGPSFDLDGTSFRFLGEKS